MKISIIIPIFNVENYIFRCLDSIYSQGVDESCFEVIAVNDGSTDKSSDIVRKFQKEHSNILLFEKNNEGVSVARNLAVEKSSGDYLAFIDPDDSILPNSLKSLMTTIESQPLIPMIIMRSYGDNGVELYKWVHLYKHMQNVGCLDTINEGYVRGSVCGCAFSRKHILNNQIKFPEGIRNSEDTIFFFQSMTFCKNCFFADIPFYQVIGREGSASRTFSIERLNSMIHSIEYVDNLLYEKNIAEIKSAILNFLKYLLISSLIYAIIKTKHSGLSYLIKHSRLSWFYVDTTNIEYLKWKMKLLNFSLPIYYLLYKIVNK